MPPNINVQIEENPLDYLAISRFCFHLLKPILLITNTIEDTPKFTFPMDATSLNSHLTVCVRVNKVPSRDGFR